jgi:hypothetical protein
VRDRIRLFSSFYLSKKVQFLPAPAEGQAAKRRRGAVNSVSGGVAVFSRFISSFFFILNLQICNFHL